MKLKTRKDKLIMLSRYLDLETNELKSDNPGNALYENVLRKNILNNKIRNCTRCQNLNIKSYTRSVLGWGCLDANIFFIGESPCTHSMVSQFPFAWKSGRILDIVLRLSNLSRYDIFISNSIHCHPESKRSPTNREITRCSRFLREELQIVSPKLVVTLGNSAEETMKNIEVSCKILSAVHPARFLYNPHGMTDYILKLSTEIDKYTECKDEKEKT